MLIVAFQIYKAVPKSEAYKTHKEHCDGIIRISPSSSVCVVYLIQERQLEDEDPEFTLYPIFSEAVGVGKQ